MIVLDASVALKFFLPEADSDAALRLLASRALLTAPDILPLELSAGVAKYHRRRLITLDEARSIADALGRLTVDQHPWQPLLAPAFELALLLNHGVYDCLYLALASQLSLPLVTADRKMRQKAGQVGLGARVHLLSDMDRLLADLAP